MSKLEKLPTAIYARISRDAEDKKEGVDRQEAECRALAAKLDWEVVAVFVDNDISAYSGKPRPQYRAMLDAVRSGAVRGIIAVHTDRLHRRTTELEEFVSIVETHQVQVETIKSGSLDLKTASGRMVARMLGAAAQGEVERTRERVKAAKDQAALDGKYRGGPRPFGYEKDGMTVRESEAELIREATRALLAGRSLAALAREFTDRGVTGTLGKPWTYNNLRDMLIRPRNAGLLARGLPGRKGRSDSEPDWSFDEDVIGPARWPAVVGVDEWRALLALLTDPGRRTGLNTEPRWLGSGIYLCGHCGAVLRAAPHGGTEMRKYARRMLYRCSASAHLTVSQELTDEFVLNVLSEKIRDPRVVAAMTPDAGYATEDKERRSALSARLQAFESDYALGRVSGAQLQKATATVNAELKEIDTRMMMSLRRSASSSILRADDPGAALLSAPLDVQRAVLATVIKVEVLGQIGPRGSAWRAERLQITPVN